MTATASTLMTAGTEMAITRTVVVCENAATTPPKSHAPTTGIKSRLTMPFSCCEPKGLSIAAFTGGCEPSGAAFAPSVWRSAARLSFRVSLATLGL